MYYNNKLCGDNMLLTCSLNGISVVDVTFVATILYQMLFHYVLLQSKRRLCRLVCFLFYVAKPLRLLFYCLPSS